MLKYVKSFLQNTAGDSWSLSPGSNFGDADKVSD